MSKRQLEQVRRDIETCRRCPRLVQWREEVAVTKRAAFADEEYWGAGVSGFGDPAARVMVLGLAPAAHGANRTGRMFTGDRSGDWLFGALHRAGFANQATSVSRDDGLELTDCWVTSPVHCAPPGNAPTRAEREACGDYLDRELAALPRLRVIVTLGHFGHNAICSRLGVSPRPKFGHGSETRVAGGPNGDVVLLGSYHVSQQNTFTGRLTESMLDDVVRRARAIADESTSKQSR